jgi:glycosyltransferase involved in cell wall biosynthesis
VNELGRGTRGVAAALELAIDGGERARSARIAAALTVVSPEHAWLLHTVIARVMPTDEQVIAAVRFARLEGAAALMRQLRRERRRHISTILSPAPAVVSDAVLVDVHETATTTLMTGVQRVARRIADAWTSEHNVTLVGWSVTRGQLRPIRLGAWQSRSRRGILGRRALAPVSGTLVVPEVITEVQRNARLFSLAAHSGLRSILIGYDAIPFAQAEVAGPGMPGAFAKYLAAASRMSLVLTDSHAAAVEYGGWRAMLASAGIAGPRIEAVPLAIEAGEASPAVEQKARELLLARDETGAEKPMVLCVGSHEPRKNHGVVLQACELLWREGLDFTAVFIGGNAWSGDEFQTRLARLQRSGRPVKALSSLGDGMLWWAYRLARLSVFPSLDEGFGLPVGESLACSTPVVTSNFGSMAEIAADGGCLLVDPTDAAAVAASMRSLLVDDALHSRLVAEAGSRPPRSWNDYTSELWTAAMA